MTLMNRYSRKYFISKDEKNRLTYDSELQFISVHNYHNFFTKKVKSTKRRVLEIKYDEHMDGHAPQI